MTTFTTQEPSSTNNIQIDEETALDWFKRSRSISPYTPVIDSFLCRRRRTAIVHQPYREECNITMGTGIRFLDQLFQSVRQKPLEENNSTTIIEVCGEPYTGKTWLAVTFAASYVAATKPIPSCDELVPQVVIFDCEYGIHMPHLASAVRTAILRRHGSAGNVDAAMREALERIHICHPNDFGIGLLSSLEVLSHSLSSSPYPILLIIDSLSSFERRDKMMEETIHSGFSGKNDFYRQLSKFLRLSSHNVVALCTRIKGSENHETWNRLVTHRVALEKVKKDTVEEREGFEFVALVGMDVLPFSIGNGGIVS